MAGGRIGVPDQNQMPFGDHGLAGGRAADRGYDTRPGYLVRAAENVELMDGQRAAVV
jgi:hypothetical protein